MSDYRHQINYYHFLQWGKILVNVIGQSYEILTDLDGISILKKIEIAARTCYKSEDRISEDGSSAMDLCRRLVKNGHFAMVEHGGLISVKIICNRGMTHELVRHRLASYGQESTRYCDYSKNRHGNEISVIKPSHMKGNDEALETWKKSMEEAERAYFRLRDQGISPQIARGVLPLDLKTEIVISANPTEWRHIFKLRTAISAHPQIRDLMRDLLEDIRKRVPILFDDISWE